MQEIQEILVGSLGQEDALEEAWQPIPIFLPGKFHGQKNLAGYSPWGCKESNMTEWAQTNPIYVEVLYACAEQILLSYWYLPHQYLTSWPIPFVEEITSYPYTTPLFFFFFATLESHGVLIPQPKIQPSSPALEAWYLKHWNHQGHPYTLFLKMTFLLEKTSNLLLKALLSSQNPIITMEDKPLKL